MFLQRYAHVVLDAVLGKYVKNIDPEALKISVWNGKIEVDAVELQPEAFAFLLPLGVRLVKGRLQQLRVDLPWTQLAQQPVRIDVADVSLLFELYNADVTAQDDAEEAQKKNKPTQDQLQRKRATLAAIEKATQFNEQSVQLVQSHGWTQSFLFKLAVKALDNVQLQVQHLHLRFEDRISDPQTPYAIGITLESLIINSADEEWNYTMVLRNRGGGASGGSDQPASALLRKKMEINKFGIYWSLPLVPVPLSALEDDFAFAKIMQMHFWSSQEVVASNANFPALFRQEDYLVEPLSVSMKLTVNDGQAKLPLTHHELSARVLERLGTPWMVETIDAIGDDAWRDFVSMMPKLAGDRKYTLGFVFSEAWSVARESTEEEDAIPSVEQFSDALCSCLQWSRHEVGRLEQCVVKYREAVVHVMDEKSTYVDASAEIDQIRISLSRSQYLSALSLLSFTSAKRRQARYMSLRPTNASVKQNPSLWWKFAIRSVLLDVRERLARVDWEQLNKQRQQRRRYMELYTLVSHPQSYAATLVSETVANLSKEDLVTQIDDLEGEWDVQELLRLRSAARKDIAAKERQRQKKHQDAQKKAAGESSDVPPATSGLWSYATWLTGGRGPATSASGEAPSSSSSEIMEEVNWSEQDTKDLYDAIDFHPDKNGSNALSDATEQGGQESAVLRRNLELQEQQHIRYRFRSTLSKASFQLNLDDGESSLVNLKQKKCLLSASLDEVDIQFLVRPSSMEVGLQIRDAFCCQNPHDRQFNSRRRNGQEFLLERMNMDEVIRHHPKDVQQQMSSIRLRHCERELPLLSLRIESRTTSKLETPQVQHKSDSHLGFADVVALTVSTKSANSQIIGISLVTQALKCTVNLMFLLDVASFFARPVHVDLSSLEQSAMRRAQSLKRYSTAQLRDALARRTKVEMRLDVTSPLINIVQATSTPPSQALSVQTQDTRVSLLVFLGHLRAITSRPNEERGTNATHDHDGDNQDPNCNTPVWMRKTAADDRIYDITEFSIAGIEVQVLEHSCDKDVLASLSESLGTRTSSWRYLLEKTSLAFRFYASIAPDDPTIPLLKLFGEVDSVHMNLSADSFRSVLRLLRSFGENFAAHTEQRKAHDTVPLSALRDDVSSVSTSDVGSPQRPSKFTVETIHKGTARQIKSYFRPSSSTVASSPPFEKQSPNLQREPASDGNIYAAKGFAHRHRHRRASPTKEIEDLDLLKLWKRVHCELRFGVREVAIRLQVSELGDQVWREKIVVTRAVDINTSVIIRSYDRRLEFALGTFAVEDILVGKEADPKRGGRSAESKRYLMVSGDSKNPLTGARKRTSTDDFLQSEKSPLIQSSEQLVRVAITNISSDAVVPKNSELWSQITYESLDASSSQYSIWQDPLLTPISVDACLRTLVVNVHQDTLAEIFLFFYPPKAVTMDTKEEMEVAPVAPSQDQNRKTSFINSAVEDSEYSVSAITPTGDQVSGTSFSTKVGAWMSTSFLDNIPKSAIHEDLPATSQDDHEETDDTDSGIASMQLRLHVDGLDLFLHTESHANRMDGSSAFISLTTEKFGCSIHRFPRYMSIFSYLSSLKICDLTLSERQLREIVSHASNDDSSTAVDAPIQAPKKAFGVRGQNKCSPGHIPTLDEVLSTLESVPAVFSCAAQFYGANAIQEAWHPGYCNRFSVRLKSPRIRFLYSFVDDFRQYFFNGVLLQTVMSTMFQDRTQMEWEGDFQLNSFNGSSGGIRTPTHATQPSTFLGSDVVSTFPLVDIQLVDAVLEMPPHRMSSEALILRYDRFRMSNEFVVENFASMDNRVVAKVLLNSSLTQLQMDLSTLRIVSNILVDSGGVNTSGGFIEQSLLGSMNMGLTVDFRSWSAINAAFTLTPVRLVCNQEQYAFVLRVPFQNFSERRRFVAAPASSPPPTNSDGNHTAATPRRIRSASGRSESASGKSGVVQGSIPEEEEHSIDDEETQERHVLVKVTIPEVTMEILHGDYGYQPSSSGDIHMAAKEKENNGSICVMDVTFFHSELDYTLSTGNWNIDMAFDGMEVRDSRVESNISSSYRDFVVFDRDIQGIANSFSVHLSREVLDVDPRKLNPESSFVSHRKSSDKDSATMSTSPDERINLFGSNRRLGSLPPYPSFYHMGQSIKMRPVVGSLEAVSAQELQDSSELETDDKPSSPSASQSCSTPKELITEPEVQPGEITAVETRMDVVVDILGFRIIPSNICYDIAQFLDRRSSSNCDDDASNESSIDNQTPSVQETATTGSASTKNDDGIGGESAAVMAQSYRRIALEIHLGPSALLLVEDPFKQKSRALMLSWEAKVTLDIVQPVATISTPVGANAGPNHLQLRINVDDIHATSRISRDSVWGGSETGTIANADCLKPIAFESVLHMDFQAEFLRFRTTFDRVMELRFGYLDFCTAVAAMENILRSPATSNSLFAGGLTNKKRSSSSASSLSMVSSGGVSEKDHMLKGRLASSSSFGGSISSSIPTLRKSPSETALGIPAVYGKSLVHLVSATFRGRLQTRPVVGLYSSPWRKRYLALPYTAQERKMVQTTAFRILPAPGSKRHVGDEIYFGDRIILEAIILEGGDLSLRKPANGEPPLTICKFDQLGASGYLGPDGSAGVYETTIWRHGSSMLNTDKGVLYDKDVIAFEELTIYRSLSKGKAYTGRQFSAATSTPTSSSLNSGDPGKRTRVQFTTGGAAEGGGYLMFNGVGDAPIPFVLTIVRNDNGYATDAEEEDNATPALPTKTPRYASVLQKLKVLEFSFPGMNATVVNDFHNMLLPLLHFRVARLHVDLRGRLEDKFTAIASLSFGVQAYNSQLAVWEPVIEDFDVNMAYHGKGGVLCEYCMSDRPEMTSTGRVLRCDGIPLCLFRPSRTAVFSDAAGRASESKHFIYQEVLHQPNDDTAKNANTIFMVVKKDFNVNISRNVINVMLHFYVLISKVAASVDEVLEMRLGPYIYVDNQSGIPFLVATQSASPTGSPTTDTSSVMESVRVPTPVPFSPSDPNAEAIQAETSAFHDRAWSRRRLSTMLKDISSSNTSWLVVGSGERVATDIVAHEAPAGCVTSPLRRLLWLKPQSSSPKPFLKSFKAIPVPIGYSNRSYLHLESNKHGRRDVKYGESIICETVAEQGTLVLRLRGKVQLTNYLSVPVQVTYNDDRQELIAPGGKSAHYIPIQYLEAGSIAFCPMLQNGKLQPSSALSIPALLESSTSMSSRKKGSAQEQKQQSGSLQSRRALTFYWDVHPHDETAKDWEESDPFAVTRPPFQLILTAKRKSERHETLISLRAPIHLENLLPYELSFRTVCLKSEDELRWVDGNTASFTGSSGSIPSGSSAHMAELEIFSERIPRENAVQQTPAIIALSIALPEMHLRTHSAWKPGAFIYGSKKFCERIELGVRDELQSDEASFVKTMSICVEVVHIDKITMGIGKEKIDDPLAPVICRLYSDYWILDRTSLSLAFYTASGFQIPCNPLGDQDSSSQVPSSSASLAVFSSEAKQQTCKMKIGIKRRFDGTNDEVRSDAFDISAVGVRGQMLIPSKSLRESRMFLSSISEHAPVSSGSTFKQYELGVMIEPGPDKFARSKVVTLVHRYYLVNASSLYEIHVRQERSTDPSGYVMLQPKETAFFHWSDSRLPSRVQIRFVEPTMHHDGFSAHETPAVASEWSSPFELSSVGNFVLRLKKSLNRSPAFLPNCYEGSSSHGVFDTIPEDEDEEVNEWNPSSSILTGGMQLQVAVELHDPSFFVYLEEGEPPSLRGGDVLETHDKKDFVPFMIKNECNYLELTVWQKTIAKDGKGNLSIGFEGGEQVLPFHTIEYVPYTFSGFPTLFVQVQSISGLESAGHGDHDKRRRGKSHKASPTRWSVTSSSKQPQKQVLVSFEIQLNKLHRLPTFDISDGKVKRRLWVEVLLDEATKTLLVTDMLPGTSGEHKRRRRATLLRTWKRYNSAILGMSYLIATRQKPVEQVEQKVDLEAKKKQVRFITGAEEVKQDSDANGKNDAQVNVGVVTDLSAIVVPKELRMYALCVRLVDAVNLEEVYIKRGRTDLSTCQPFVLFSVQAANGEQVRSKLQPQPFAVFPRWLPTKNGVKNELELRMLVPEPDQESETISTLPSCSATLVVEVREADTLFGSTLLGTVRIPLEEYFRAVRASSNLQPPEVLDFLVPVEVMSKDRHVESSFYANGDGAMIRLEMCCQYIQQMSGSEVDPFQQVNEAVIIHCMKDDLDKLLLTKSHLKVVLERESVEITAGNGNETPQTRGAWNPLSGGDPKSHAPGLDRLPELSSRSSADDRSRRSYRGDSSQSVTTDEDTSDMGFDELGDEKRLSAVLIGVSNLQIPRIEVGQNAEKEAPEPKLYCTITYKDSTRSAPSAVAKVSTEDSADEETTSSNERTRTVRTSKLPRGQTLGLDLVYNNGRVLVQGVVRGGPCGGLLDEGKIRIGDSIVAVNQRSIVNLHRDACFRAIETARQWADDTSHDETSDETFTLSFVYQPLSDHIRVRHDSSAKRTPKRDEEDAAKQRGFDVEWNRRVEFIEPYHHDAHEVEKPEGTDTMVLVRVYLRNDASDHGLLASQESSVVPFLYFFGDDTMMDRLDHSKQDSRFDVLLAESWVPLPTSTNAALHMSIPTGADAAFHERICALYPPHMRSQTSTVDMIGQLHLALKWEYLNSQTTSTTTEDLHTYLQLEVARICVSIIDDGSGSNGAASIGSTPQQPKEVLCISMSDQQAAAGILLSYGVLSDGKHVANARVGHLQIDNQLMDTNYPVFLYPMRLVDSQQQHDLRDEQQDYLSPSSGQPALLPTFQLMGVFHRKANVVQFDYIFAQLQELEIKLEDATLVALAQVFKGVHWSISRSEQHGEMGNPLGGVITADDGRNWATHLLQRDWSMNRLSTTAISGNSRSSGGGGNKVLLRWLLLCRVEVKVTFTSTSDRSLLLSLLSPDMSSVLRTLISAAAALVSNLDQASINIPEFYVENLLETTHTLAFYAMQHYVHHGLRSWYNIMGSVDFLGNPVGLVSTLGTGVKDFFYTPAQMLLDDESGFRIENLRTGMTKGSKSLLRNTAVGIFHTTGKITETLGKGIAMLAMDEEYNIQRQRKSSKQMREINDLGDAITEGSKGFVGGVWDGIKGVVAAPVEGAERDGAGGFVVGIGKGFAGLVVKPTAGFLDLLTSLSRGAKTSAAAIDGDDSGFQTASRFRLPRRICSDGVVVAYSEREARGNAILLLTSLDTTDEYVYHVYYRMESLRGLVLLTDKRILCLSARSGQKLWEFALDSTLEVTVTEPNMMQISQSTAAHKSYNLECEDAASATNFQLAVESARIDLAATRYLLLNLEKNQEEAKQHGSTSPSSSEEQPGLATGRRPLGLQVSASSAEGERTDLHMLMENVQDTMVTGLTSEDLQAQPLRSVRVELCHLENKDAHANVPTRAVDSLLSFSVFQIHVYGGPYQWTVFRRFSEFRALFAAVEQEGYNMDSLPPLPPRTFLPSTRDAVAKSRQEMLSLFLQASIMHASISRSPAMLGFLTREAQEVRVSLPPLSPTLETS